MQETLSTLRFGSKASLIQNHPIIIVEKSPAELKQELKVANEKIESLQEYIKKLKEGMTANENTTNIIVTFNHLKIGITR